MKNPRMQAWLTRPGGLAAMLRTARGSQSVRQIADAAGWQSSKVSRIETGGQIPTEDDLGRWAAATGASKKLHDSWLTELGEVMSMRSTFQRRQEVLQATPQATFNDLESIATYIRAVQPDGVPALLQTQEYARALLGQDGRRAVDVDQAISELMRRQSYLHESAKRFEFVIGESALRFVPGHLDVMGAQLDRLISASDLRNVRLGIVPMLKPLTRMLPPAPFVLYDDETAVSEDWVEGRQYSGASVRVFGEKLDELWAEAVEGDAARRLILDAQAALAACR